MCRGGAQDLPNSEFNIPDSHTTIPLIWAVLLLLFSRGIKPCGSLLYFRLYIRMKWKPFTFQDQQYDLSHLHPFELEVVHAAPNNKPAITYSFEVHFSLHCFSKSILSDDDRALAYSDNRETRTFCFDRYRLSQQLPAIIKDIGNKRCNHTGKGNFFIVELIDDTGNNIEYEIYFDVSGQGKKQPMRLYIQSAYVRNDESRAYRHKTKKISFYVIAHNRKSGKPIRTPR